LREQRLGDRRRVERRDAAEQQSAEDGKRDRAPLSAAAPEARNTKRMRTGASGRIASWKPKVVSTPWNRRSAPASESETVSIGARSSAAGRSQEISSRRSAQASTNPIRLTLSCRARAAK